MTLDPKLDVVFKLLFSSERNRDILVAFLSAVLKPASPITHVVIQNPDIPGPEELSRRIVLDVRVRLKNGEHINVEMQARRHSGKQERWLFHWARMYTDQLGRGDEYEQLRPVVCIIIMNFHAFDAGPFHSTFKVREVHDHREFSRHLSIHTLGLPKLKAAPTDVEDQTVLAWGKFFSANSDEELEQLAMDHPDILRAKEALDELSADPAARALALSRELAELDYVSSLREAERTGKAEGKAEGVRFSVQQLCSAFGVEITGVRKEQLDAATLEELQAIHSSILRLRTWPE